MQREDSHDSEEVKLSWAEESQSEDKKFTKTEDLFNREKALENEEKKVSECTETDLMEILWRRGNDNLNIALHKGIEKLYRMLRGDRLHPPRERGNRGRKNRVRKHD